MTIPNLNLAEFESVVMDFGSTACWHTVPAVAGWYVIGTNAPLEVLAQCPVPAAGSRHYLIAQRLQEAGLLLGQGAVIVPASTGAPYIVYSGEHGDLKARAREHIRGSKGTGCLSLSQYEVAKAYEWTFYCRACEEHVPGSEGNMTLRNYLEQKWRAVNGWSILCSR